VVGDQFHCTTQYLFLIPLNWSFQVFFFGGGGAVALHSTRGVPDLEVLKTSGKGSHNCHGLEFA